MIKNPVVFIPFVMLVFVLGMSFAATYLYFYPEDLKHREGYKYTIIDREWVPEPAETAIHKEVICYYWPIPHPHTDKKRFKACEIRKELTK